MVWLAMFVLFAIACGTVGVALQRFDRTADDVEMAVYREQREAFERMFE